eukprot:474153-Rhodomonas_salina.1
MAAGCHGSVSNGCVVRVYSSGTTGCSSTHSSHHRGEGGTQVAAGAVDTSSRGGVEVLAARRSHQVRSSPPMPLMSDAPVIRSCRRTM